MNVSAVEKENADEQKLLVNQSDAPMCRNCGPRERERERARGSVFSQAMIIHFLNLDFSYERRTFGVRRIFIHFCHELLADRR